MKNVPLKSIFGYFEDNVRFYLANKLILIFLERSF